MLKYSTSCVEHKHKKYCLYCGNEIEVVEDYYGNHGRDCDYYYPCECDGAKEEQLLLERLKVAKKSLNLHIERAIAVNKMAMAKKEQEEKVRELTNNDVSRSQILVVDMEKA